MHCGSFDIASLLLGRFLLNKPSTQYPTVVGHFLNPTTYIEDCMRAVHSFWHCKSTVRLRLTLNILQLYVSHFMNPTTLRIGGRVPCTSSSTFTFTPNSAVQRLFLPLPAHSHEYIWGCKIFPFCTLADVTFQQFNNNQNCAFSAECTSHFTYWTAECTIADFPAVFLDALASLKPHYS